MYIAMSFRLAKRTSRSAAERKTYHNDDITTTFSHADSIDHSAVRLLTGDDMVPSRIWVIAP